MKPKRTKCKNAQKPQENLCFVRARALGKGSRGVQHAPKRAQEEPKLGQRWPKMGEDWVKMGSAWSKMAKTTLKMRLQSWKMRFRSPGQRKRCIFRCKMAPGSEKPAFYHGKGPRGLPKTPNPLAGYMLIYIYIYIYELVPKSCIKAISK